MSTFRQSLAPFMTPLHRLYWRFSRPMSLGARVIAQAEDGTIMLIEHTYKKGWYLPGGGVERLEFVEDAARRELAEEAGLMAEPGMALFGVFANHNNYPNDHIVVFHTDAFTPCPPRSDGEILQRGFFPPDALPDDTTPGTRRRLKELAEGGTKSPHW
jgi:ADP-ribose pyrophosphatase YjhB (NUDIX family)